MLSFVGSFFPSIQNINNTKPIIPYNEPSHYALFFMPFLYYKTFTANTQKKIIYIIIGGFIALFLKNFTLLVGVALCIILNFRKKSIIILVVTGLLMFFYLDLTYFSDRLKLTTDSDNLSVLVFVQGWQLAYNSLKETYGLGIGIQQLGFVKVETEAGDTIIRLLGRNVNDTDAGLTFGKIVSEFGLLGVFLIIIYLKYFYKIYIKISTIKNKNILFACSIYFAFSLDIFIRGIGYFNTPFLLFFTAIFILKNYFKHENNLR